MSAHTPGPWEIQEEGSTQRYIVIRAALRDWTPKLATVHVAGRERESNARLIAAAPDLLAALRGLRTHYEGVDRFCDHDAEPCHRCEAAAAAVRKAEGK